MNKQPAITDATRNIFIEVFCDFYETKPIEKITVKEIVQKAGYSRATFYNYFRDTYELLEYIENSFISDLIKTITNNIEKHHVIDDFVHTFIELIESERMYIKCFINSSSSSSFIERLRMEAVPLLLTALHVSSDNITAKYALEFYISGVVPVIGTWLRRNQDISIEDMAQLIKGILQEVVLKQVKH